MTIVITAFERSPDGGKGLARDTRVRWALEEVGQPYEVRLVSFRAKKEPAHLRLHPFGLIPTYEEGEGSTSGRAATRAARSRAAGRRRRCPASARPRRRARPPPAPRARTPARARVRCRRAAPGATTASCWPSTVSPCRKKLAAPTTSPPRRARRCCSGASGPRPRLARTSTARACGSAGSTTCAHARSAASSRTATISRPGGGGSSSASPSSTAPMITRAALGPRPRGDETLAQVDGRDRVGEQPLRRRVRSAASAPSRRSSRRRHRRGRCRRRRSRCSTPRP